MAEETKYLRAVKALRTNYQQRTLVSDVGRFYYCLHLLYDIASLVSIYKGQIEKIKARESFDLKILIGIDYTKWINRDTWNKIEDTNQNINQSYSVSITGQMGDVSLANFVKDYIGLDGNIEGLRELTKALNQLNHVEVWSRYLETGIDKALGDLINQFSTLINVVKDTNLDNQYANLMDDLQSGLNLGEMALEYNKDIKGYLGDYTKDDLLDDLLWKYVGKIINTGFFEFVKARVSNANNVSELYEKAKKVDDFSVTEKQFKQFNKLFVYNAHNRYEMDKGKMAQYIFEFRENLKCNQIDALLDFLFVLRKIYKDVDALEPQQAPEQITEAYVVNMLEELVGVLEENHMIDDEFGREKMSQFFKNLLGEENESKDFIMKKLKPTRSVKYKINGISVNPYLMILGTLNKIGGVLKNVDSGSVRAMLERLNVNIDEGTCKRYFTGGENRTEPWTEKGNKRREKSEQTYEYIERIVNIIKMS